MRRCLTPLLLVLCIGLASGTFFSKEAKKRAVVEAIKRAVDAKREVEAKRELDKNTEKEVSERDAGPGQGRVSFRECNLEAGARENCGYFGIDQYECYSRGCCWGESEDDGVPWCYHSIPTLKPQCVVNNDERQECGYFGIRKESCLYEGCCWKPNSDPSAPWCYHEIRLPIFEGECGIPVTNPNVASRIVNGIEAIPNSWPWMVSLQISSSYWSGHFCGGSLLNNQWVVSAAHCEMRGETVLAVVGNHQLYETDPTEVAHEVEEQIPHPDYDRSTIDNDILLLRLKEPVDFNNAVAPICLPEAGSNITSGRRCYDVGWGNTEHGGDAPETLQQVAVPLLNREDCQELYAQIVEEDIYDSYGLDYTTAITENMVCAGYPEGGRGACHGDSGGPLNCYNQDEEHWELEGTVSWGAHCAGESSPGVHAKVSNYNQWIEDTINDYEAKRK